MRLGDRLENINFIIKAVAIGFFYLLLAIFLIGLILLITISVYVLIGQLLGVL